MCLLKKVIERYAGDDKIVHIVYSAGAKRLFNVPCQIDDDTINVIWSPLSSFKRTYGVNTLYLRAEEETWTIPDADNLMELYHSTRLATKVLENFASTVVRKINRRKLKEQVLSMDVSDEVVYMWQMNIWQTTGVKNTTRKMILELMICVNSLTIDYHYNHNKMPFRTHMLKYIHFIERNKRNLAFLHALCDGCIFKCLNIHNCLESYRGHFIRIDIPDYININTKRILMRYNLNSVSMERAMRANIQQMNLAIDPRFYDTKCIQCDSLAEYRQYDSVLNIVCGTHRVCGMPGAHTCIDLKDRLCNDMRLLITTPLINDEDKRSEILLGYASACESLRSVVDNVRSDGSLWAQMLELLVETEISEICN